MADIKMVLVRALVDLATAIDQSEDEDIDPDVAVPMLEQVAATLGALSPEQQREVAALVRACADEEADVVWREAMLAFPDGVGLLDDVDHDHADSRIYLPIVDVGGRGPS
jgi:hypothetical protein